MIVVGCDEHDRGHDVVATSDNLGVMFEMVDGCCLGLSVGCFKRETFQSVVDDVLHRLFIGERKCAINCCVIGWIEYIDPLGAGVGGRSAFYFSDGLRIGLNV